MSAPTARNPRAEATALLGEGYQARVLEPSPPAVDDGDFYADDPVARGDVPAGITVVSPVPTGDVTWDEIVSQRPDLADFARSHWLGNVGSLRPVPDGLVEGRTDLHRLAFYVVSPARSAVNGKIGLRYTHRGFGTPFFGDDTQVRVEGAHLVVQHGDHVHAEPITTLRRAAELVGVEVDPSRGDEFDVPDAGDLDRPLAATTEIVDFLGDWFGFATLVFEELRAGAGPDDDASRVQLWPEHFDPAVEIGRAEQGRRASYGGSPGDEAHPEPYLYVAAWETVDRSEPFWNDEAFNGASISYAQLAASPDPRAAALEFLRRGAKLLAS